MPKLAMAFESNVFLISSCTPQLVEAFSDIVATQVRAGPGCSAVVAADDSVWVWGANDNDRLGQDKPIIFGFKVCQSLKNLPSIST
jgi:alpha-tubulin suppressor-like RCC1 family protein